MWKGKWCFKNWTSLETVIEEVLISKTLYPVYALEYPTKTLEHAFGSNLVLWTIDVKIKQRQPNVFIWSRDGLVLNSLIYDVSKLMLLRGILLIMGTVPGNRLSVTVYTTNSFSAVVSTIQRFWFKFFWHGPQMTAVLVKISYIP